MDSRNKLCLGVPVKLGSSDQSHTWRRSNLRVLLVLLAAAAPALATEGELMPGARNAQHVILPFVGYQYLNGEQRGVDWRFDYVTGGYGLPDSILHFEASPRAERDIKTPVLGLMYRYRFHGDFQVEAAASLLQDRALFTYPVVTDYFGYQFSDSIKVQRRNTTTLTAAACYAFRTPYSWLSGALNFGGGRAWRSIEASWDDGGYSDAYRSFTLLDADQMWVLKGGVDLSFWSGDNLLLQGGLSYTNYFPVDSKLDPFGGIGWRFSVFPIWSAR